MANKADSSDPVPISPLLEIEFISDDVWRNHFVTHRIGNESRRVASKGAYFANAIREKISTVRTV